MKPVTVTPIKSTLIRGRTNFRASAISPAPSFSDSAHLELVKGRRTLLGPPYPGSDVDQMFRKNAAVVRAVSHEDVAVGAGLVANGVQVAARGDLQVHD